MHLYTKKEKEILGRYFNIYKSTNNIQTKEILKYISCSYPTFKEIESGIPKNNDEIYDEIITYLNLNYLQDNQLFDECLILINQLYQSIEKQDNLKINQFVEQLKIKLSQKEKYIIYNELKYSLELIEKLYLKNEYLSIEEMDKTLQLIQLWNNSLSSILIEVYEKSNLNLYYNTELSDNIYRLIQPKDSISKYWYARECVMHVNYITGLEHYKELIEYYTSVNNYERKVLVMLKEFGIYRDIDENKAIQYVKELDKVLLEDISNKLKKNINHAIAMFYYLRKQYEKSLDYFNESYSYGYNPVCLLYIYSCESKLNNLELKPRNNNCSPVIEKYISYFEMKAKGENIKDLEKYIMNELLNILKEEKYYEPLWSMFEYELRQLVKKTRNYKNLKTFIEKNAIIYKKCPLRAFFTIVCNFHNYKKIYDKI